MAAVMARGLDHIVHAVRDLEVAVDFYRRAGFSVGARNVHPWGTHNHIVQLPGFFIEILAVAEPAKLAGDGLSRQFGVANREAIARGEGFSFLMLQSMDIDADCADFARNHIGASSVLSFSREAALPDGGHATVGFSLAFARDELSPLTGFAACQQLTPDVFWNVRDQSHANSVNGVAGAVLVAENPADHHIFLNAFTGIREIHASSAGVKAVTPRGEVDIMEVVSFSDAFGVTPRVVGQGTALKGLRLIAKDLGALERVLSGSGIAFHRHIGRVVIPPEAALGATLIFEQAAAA